MTFLGSLALLLAAGVVAPTGSLTAAAQSTTSQPSFFLQDPSDGETTVAFGRALLLVYVSLHTRGCCEGHKLR